MDSNISILQQTHQTNGNQLLNQPYETHMDGMYHTPTSKSNHQILTFQCLSTKHKSTALTSTKAKRSSSERGLRFRQRQREFEQTLEINVRQLKNTITALQIRRNLFIKHEENISDTMNLSMLCRMKVQEYMDLFRNGVPTLIIPGGAICRARQVRFLQSFLHRKVNLVDDLTGQVTIGAVHLFEQYVRCTRAFGTTSVNNIVIDIIEMEPVPIVRLQYISTQEYTWTTITNLYPHVTPQSPLAKELIGIQADVMVTKIFHFNKCDHGINVVAIHSNMEYLPGLIKAIGDISKALFLVNHSVYHLNGNILPPIQEIHM